MVTSVSKKRRRSRSCSNYGFLKPALIGIAASVIVTMLFIMLFAVAFVIMKSIVSSALVPLSLFALTIGCLTGSYICARISCERGFIYGISIGLSLFLVVYVLSLALGENYFGTLLIIRLCCLLISGGFGGWLGSDHAHTLRK